MRSVAGTLAVVIAIGAAELACGSGTLDPARGVPPWSQRRDAAADVQPNDAVAPADVQQPRDAATDILPRDATASTDAPRADAVTDQRAGDGPPGVEGGGGPDGAVDAGPRRMLTQVLEGAPWYATQATQGIAVDSRGRVYVGDHDNVFMVEADAVTTHLTATEAGGTGFGDFDIDSDDRLYIVTVGRTPGLGVSVVRSSQPHQIDPWIDLSPTLTDASKLAVIDDGTIAVISRAGFWTFTDAGGAQIYSQSQMVGSSGCATQDLAAAPSGVFLYQPGCNGSPLLRGHSDGTGVGILYNTSFGQPSEISASNFLCVARDPSGGFYVVVDGIGETPRLYHVAEDAQGTSGLTWIDTTPSFAQAKARASSVFGFRYCSLAAARDGTVYFQSYAQLWKVAP
jgi:hypothetical protein